MKGEKVEQRGMPQRQNLNRDSGVRPGIPSPIPVKKVSPHVRRLVLAFYFFFLSYFTAVSGYYLMWYIMPAHYVFGALPWMYTYHQQHPEQYIMVCCAAFSLVGSILLEKFNSANAPGRILICFAVVCFTILISAPLGGMLWHYHDMVAGFWPADYWTTKLFVRGPLEGLKLAVPILVLSLPYVLCGCIVMFLIMLSGSKILDWWRHSSVAYKNSDL